MKRSMQLFILITLLLVMPLLSSCKIKFSRYSATGAPEYSENFNEEFFASFYEKYPTYDENLYYFSAAPWEAEAQTARDRMAFAMIDGVDKKDFVAGTEIIAFIGPPSFITQIYQSADAPVPMRDWTISEITLLGGGKQFFVPTDFNDVSVSEFAQHMMEYHLSTLDEIKVFDRESDPKIFDIIKNGYAEPHVGLVNLKSFEKEYYDLDRNSPSSNTQYFLLVRFEENDNIVWCSKIYRKDGILYLECSIRNSVLGVVEEQLYLSLGREYSEAICELLDIRNKIPEETDWVTEGETIEITE